MSSRVVSAAPIGTDLVVVRVQHTDTDSYSRSVLPTATRKAMPLMRNPASVHGRPWRKYRRELTAEGRIMGPRVYSIIRFYREA